MKRTLVTGLCLGAALAVAAVLPQSASAATVDINGHMVDEGVKIVNGTTHARPRQPSRCDDAQCLRGKE